MSQKLPIKVNGLTLLGVFLLVIPLATLSANAADTVELTPTENHHIVELDSNQPYVAGFHVNAPDLNNLTCGVATAVTVSFPSTNTSYFPQSSWLGAGMFVQA